MKFAGNVVLDSAREIVTVPSSSGWRKHFQRAAVELGQLVEKQHAVMRKRDFAWGGRRAAADQARVADRVVRRAEGPHGQERLARRSRPTAL